jgi:hypothetical protein
MKIPYRPKLRLVFTTAAVLAGLAGLATAHGQEATERYIPIGQSPDMSSIHTDIAKIAAVNLELGTVTLAAANRTWSISVSERTRIWIDRTSLGLTNLRGSLADLKEGLRVEVKYEDPERKMIADWIKVAPAGAE